MFKGKKGRNIENTALMTTQRWVPVEDIRDGIVKLKTGDYVKIIEVMPVNFKLKSIQEQRAILLEYKSFLKACQFDMQIVVQSKRADTSSHTNRIKQFYSRENNIKVKEMMMDYINLVQNMSLRRKSISRRFFTVITYKPPADTALKNVKYEDIVQDLHDKALKVKEYLGKCGNTVVEYEEHSLEGTPMEDNEIANILYTYFNKRLAPIQNLENKPLTYVNDLAPTTIQKGTFLERSEWPRPLTLEGEE